MIPASLHVSPRNVGTGFAAAAVFLRYPSTESGGAANAGLGDKQCAQQRRPRVRETTPAWRCRAGNRKCLRTTGFRRKGAVTCVPCRTRARFQPA